MTALPGADPAHLLQPMGIVSGTGPAGAALAARLVANGQHVVVGSRDFDRANAVIDALRAEATHPELVVGGTNADAAACEFVVLATNADYIVDVVRELAPKLEGKIVVSMAARIQRAEGRGFRPDPPAIGSLTAEIAQVVPTAHIVAALQHVPAKALGDISTPYDGDVLVCGDDADAVQTVIERLGPVSAGSFLDAGGLANAVPIEAMTAVLVSLNVRYREKYSLQLLSSAPAAADKP